MAKRTVLITGAAGAIGAALCRAFKDDDYRVIGTDRNRPGDTCCDSFVDVDLNLLVEDTQYRERALRNISEAIGDPRLDALVNNAAVQIVAPVYDLTADSWRESLNVNVVAPFLLVQASLSALRAAKGAVVNVGSIHSRLTKPKFSCYSTSKAALSGLTRALAIELGNTVRINEIAPGATETPMLLAGLGGKKEVLEALRAAHPLGRIASPDEIARVAVFLASERAAFITGSTLQIDGGIGARLHDPE